MKRISIYFLWDKCGEVADYVLYQLREMRKCVSESCVVVNGELSDAGRAAIEKVADTILVRENKGMDAAAYQHAIRYYGYERLGSYDELILWNYTCYGPFWPFMRVFEEMDNRDCEFWGLGRWPTYAPYREYHHIPSYFCGYRKSLMQSELFRNYWENLGDTSTYELSVKNHEQLQTPYYEENGIKTSTWLLNTEKYKGLWATNMMPLICTDRMLIEDYFPLVKRRIFYPSATGYSLYSPIALSVLKHIEACCADYDLSLIVKDLQRTRMVEPYNISPWRLLGLKLHMRLAFTRAKRMKRAQKYEWARQSCELYQFLTQYSN